MQKCQIVSACIDFSLPYDTELNVFVFWTIVEQNSFVTGKCDWHVSSFFNILQWINYLVNANYFCLFIIILISCSQKVLKLASPHLQWSVCCVGNKCTFSKLIFNGWIGVINPFSLNSRNPGCCMSNKAAAACPIRMTQTHWVEDFQENVRPATNLNWLDESQQLFTDGCQLSLSPMVMHLLFKKDRFVGKKRQ